MFDWIQGSLVILVVGCGLGVLAPVLYALNRFISSRRKPAGQSQGLFPTLGGPE